MRFASFMFEETSSVQSTSQSLQDIGRSRRQEVEDAQKIRRSVMNCFEKADLPSLSEEEKKKNLHFVVIGGGPTGVESAAELHDFVSEDLVAAQEGTYLAQCFNKMKECEESPEGPLRIRGSGRHRFRPFS